MCLKVFVSGDRAGVGKTTVCLGLLEYLVETLGAEKVAYIKPATQSEKGDLVSLYCEAKGVRHVGGSRAPLVFYPGLTRAVISGEARVSLAAIAAAVEAVCEGKSACVIDGVGYPAVGSCVGASNADVARACRAPVVIVGRAGVGGAIDAHCLNAALFEKAGVPILGAIFNMADSSGFYARDRIKLPLERYFAHSRPREVCYGIVPLFDALAGGRSSLELAERAANHVAAFVDFRALIKDAELDAFNRRRDNPSLSAAPRPLPVDHDAPGVRERIEATAKKVAPPPPRT
ncbi:hypothetical protein CTAYLR_007425 [Chrysophaeum taylorii]|uniref:Uncharacterized protein n=1 Tax=Chrysophaeum taylorii TaxID=2483200 RepID=A0AAD7U6V2_9STRA|nr:hypothetical protein CTAYLR_007425 [Chrysophaeum taylorii]